MRWSRNIVICFLSVLLNHHLLSIKKIKETSSYRELRNLSELLKDNSEINDSFLEGCLELSVKNPHKRLKRTSLEEEKSTLLKDESTSKEVVVDRDVEDEPQGSSITHFSNKNNTNSMINKLETVPSMKLRRISEHIWIHLPTKTNEIKKDERSTNFLLDHMTFLNLFYTLHNNVNFPYLKNEFLSLSTNLQNRLRVDIIEKFENRFNVKFRNLKKSKYRKSMNKYIKEQVFIPDESIKMWIILSKSLFLNYSNKKMKHFSQTDFSLFIEELRKIDILTITPNTVYDKTVIITYLHNSFSRYNMIESFLSKYLKHLRIQIESQEYNSCKFIIKVLVHLKWFELLNTTTECFSFENKVETVLKKAKKYSYKELYTKLKYENRKKFKKELKHIKNTWNTKYSHSFLLLLMEYIKIKLIIEFINILRKRQMTYYNILRELHDINSTICKNTLLCTINSVLKEMKHLCNKIINLVQIQKSTLELLKTFQYLFKQNAFAKRKMLYLQNILLKLSNPVILSKRRKTLRNSFNMLVVNYNVAMHNTYEHVLQRYVD